MSNAGGNGYGALTSENDDQESNNNNNRNIDNTNSNGRFIIKVIADVISLFKGEYKNLSPLQIATIIFNTVSAIIWIIKSIRDVDSSRFNIIIAIFAVLNVSLIISYILKAFRKKKIRIILSKHLKTLIYWTVTNTTNNVRYYVGVKRTGNEAPTSQTHYKSVKVNNFELILSDQRPVLDSHNALDFMWVFIHNGKDRSYDDFQANYDKRLAFSLYSLSASGYVCAKTEILLI